MAETCAKSIREFTEILVGRAAFQAGLHPLSYLPAQMIGSTMYQRVLAVPHPRRVVKLATCGLRPKLDLS